ncbi:hypothetical protein ACYSNO_10785 [Enterococcus sp. LJL98]
MFMNLRMKLQHFMRGRYGRFDALNKTLIVSSLIFLFFANFGILWPLRIFAYGLFIWAYIRLLSKKIYHRSNENQKFIVWRMKYLKKWQLMKKKFSDRKTYAYFRCKTCQQQLRAPRGRGKIKVTCSKCHQSFVKKV